MKHGTILLLVLALLLSGAVVFAQYTRTTPGTTTTSTPSMMGTGDQDDMCKMMLDRMKTELGLTPSQVTQLQTLHKQFMDSTASTRADLKAKMKEMSDLWMADTPDAAAIKSLASQMDVARAGLRDMAIDHMISVMAILTPDQRAKAHDWMMKNPHMMMGMGCGLACGAGMRCGMGMGMGKGARMGSGPGACNCFMK